MTSYVTFVVLAGATTVRDASGIVEEIANGTQFYCYPNRDCEWGLMNSYSVSNSVCNEQKIALNLTTTVQGPKQNIASTTFLTFAI